MGGVGSGEEGAVEWLRIQVEADLDRFGWIKDHAGSLAVAFEEAQVAEARQRVADCEAKLAILDLLEDQLERDPRENDGYSEGRDDGEIKRDEALADFAGDVLSLLAQGYRHRDGYAEHWPGQA